MSKLASSPPVSPRLSSVMCCGLLVAFAVMATASSAAAQRWGVTYSRSSPSYGYSSGYSLNSYAAPSVVSGSGRYYGQYSPALANAGYYGTIYDDVRYENALYNNALNNSIYSGAQYYSAYRPQYGVPSRYLTYNGPGSLSRLYYYGGLYRTPTRLYSGGSRLYGSRYSTYTSPYGPVRPSGGSIIYVPQRVAPRVRYRFVQ